MFSFLLSLLFMVILCGGIFIGVDAVSTKLLSEQINADFEKELLRAKVERRKERVARRAGRRLQMK